MVALVATASIGDECALEPVVLGQTLDQGREREPAPARRICCKFVRRVRIG